jgi:hypothetical protein
VQAEAQVEEYDLALIPGISETERELDKAEAKLQQVLAELKDAEDSVDGYYAERKAYLEAAGYFALAEALSLSDVTGEHDEKTKAEINQVGDGMVTPSLVQQCGLALENDDWKPKTR